MWLEPLPWGAEGLSLRRVAQVLSLPASAASAVSRAVDGTGTHTNPDHRAESNLKILAPVLLAGKQVPGVSPRDPLGVVFVVPRSNGRLVARKHTRRANLGIGIWRGTG
jgi:hypothetical protein